MSFESACAQFHVHNHDHSVLKACSELVTFSQEILERREEMDEAEEAGRNSDNALVVGQNKTLPNVPAPALGQQQARYIQ